MHIYIYYDTQNAVFRKLVCVVWFFASAEEQDLVVLWGFPAELPSPRLCLAPANASRHPGGTVGHGTLAQHQRDTWKAKHLRWKSLTTDALDGNIHPRGGVRPGMVAVHL